jgi:hypothetical protein
MANGECRTLNFVELQMRRHVNVDMQTTVDLPEEQIKALDQYSRAEGISRAEADRRAVASFLPTKPKSKNWLNKHPAIGAWPHGNSDNWVANLRDRISR